MIAEVGKVSIRAAGTADVPALGLYGAALMDLHHAWDPRRFIPARPNAPQGYAHWLAGQLGKSDVVVLVAEYNGSLCGYTYSGLEGHDYMALRGPAGVIHDLFVDPIKRKNGIGRTLLEATIAELRARGAEQVVLQTAQANEVAQKLFASVGFRATMIEMTRTLTTDDGAPEPPKKN